MSNYQDTLDELFLDNLNYKYIGTELPVPEISNNSNILSYRKEFTAKDLDIIVVECKDRITEFQKKLIHNQKDFFPNAHFLFISNEGKVFDLYNNAISKQLKRLTYDEIGRNTRLFKEKIQFFDINKAEGTTDLQIKAQKAFDVTDKITKKFFDHFKKLHDKLQNAISGIEDESDIRWYASVLLNRIMFIYFLQKHKVLQNDDNFLLTKFNEVEENKGDYYKDFLLPLFFLGFAKHDNDKKKINFTKKYGPVRYLNGGLFYPHHIEKKYTQVQNEIVQKAGFEDNILSPEINVDAAILKDIFIFLNGYTWYLDSRPMKDEKDINPDVLGFIFEKYINQKELGAYYTKEDITDYISKNTIIPFICNKLIAKGFNVPDPTSYISNNTLGNAKENILTKFIDECKDYEALKYLYSDILIPLSVLDPSVGSGAFLFAGLNILLPIYQKTVFNLKTFEGKVKDNWLTNLIKTLSLHSEEYFLTKQIILNNLYGVDIVEEATEICKLRLFLQLASHLPDITAIEPLPDIDFNIYAGNSLVGGLSKNDLKANYAMSLFVDDVELDKDIDILATLKQEYRTLQQKDDDNLSILKEQIISLEDKINSHISLQTKTKPFHWFVEFKNIMDNGGFDVIIGNPPYVEYSKIKKNYELNNYKTIECGNLHSFFYERSKRIISEIGCLSFIVPLSVISTPRMSSQLDLFFKTKSNLYFSSFECRPGKLFEGADVRLTIILDLHNPNQVNNISTTKLIKFYTDEREQLFNNIKYVSLDKIKVAYSIIPKLNSELEISIYNKLFSQKNKIISYTTNNSNNKLYYSYGFRYWAKILDKTTYFQGENADKSTGEKDLNLLPNIDKDIIGCILSSSLFYWYYVVTSDAHNFTKHIILNFPFDYSFNINLKEKFNQLQADLQDNSIIKNVHYKTTGNVSYQEFYVKKSKHILDEIDKLLANHYGFTNEETEFIINYDLKFRLGDENVDE